jgi:ferric-dicitrate binding protein FerR (iron transport regulator)
VAKYNEIDEGLLVRYLLNETSEAEKSRFEEWVNASSENKKQFEHFLIIWEQSGNIPIEKKIPEDEAWQRMKMRLNQAGPATPVKSISTAKLAWRAAAVFVIAVCAGWLGYVIMQYYANARVTTVQVASVARVITDTLPDGSIVTVNKNSFLTFPSKFTGNTREVTLNGEAFFTVRADKKHPFIIHANDITIRVVGTAFNVKSTNGKTEVIVESGVVQVVKARKTVRLEAKEKTITSWYDSSLLKAGTTDKLYNYYHSKEFVCNATPLQQLVETLNAAYDANIVIKNDSLRDLKITTVFKNESLDTIISIISETLKIKVERNGKTIMLN